jgi:thiol-disulfide isomerase/thioredoxin
MSKAARIRQENARAKIAAQQAAARRADFQKRLLLASGIVAIVVAVVVAIVIVKLLPSSSSGSSSSPDGVSQPSSVTSDIAHVPASTFNSVGAGITYDHAVQTISPAGSKLTANGKPEMLYVGAQWCPYCAAERWAMATALSRFGTFSNLHFIHSSSTDVHPSTPTLTFYKSSYSSKYVVFKSVESATVNKVPLQTITKSDTALMNKYDVPPYVPSSQYDGSFPFVDFGNQYVIAGASYDPGYLHGMTWAQVAAALKNPASPIAKRIDGTANQITAAICKITGGKPGNVCTSAGVKAASGKI